MALAAVGSAVSAMSLSMALGGLAGNLVVPALAAAFGTDAGFLVVAAVLVSTLACLRLPRAPVAAGGYWPR